MNSEDMCKNLSEMGCLEVINDVEKRIGTYSLGKLLEGECVESSDGYISKQLNLYNACVKRIQQLVNERK